MFLTNVQSLNAGDSILFKVQSSSDTLENPSMIKQQDIMEVYVCAI